MITLFGRAGRHRRRWNWRWHRDDHVGPSPEHLRVINERYQSDLLADRQRRRATAGAP